MAFKDPTEAGLFGPPSNLADVVQQVKDAFDLSGDATPIMMGAHYLDTGPGRTPRVLFVDEPTGTWGEPFEMGNAARVVHSVTVYVAGPELDGDDIGRYRAAYRLADKVMSALRRAASGRLGGGAFGAAGPTKAAAGAELQFSFTFQRDVLHNAEVVAVAAAPDGTAVQTPAGMVPGELATGVDVGVEVQPPEIG